jgi:hypothetical protein
MATTPGVVMVQENQHHRDFTEPAAPMSIGAWNLAERFEGGAKPQG